MNILAIAYSYNGKGKSESVVTFELCKALEAFGHKITVLTRDNCFDDNVVNLGQSKILKQSSSIGKAHKSDYYTFIQKCYRYAKENLSRYEVIHHMSPISLRYHNPLSGLDRPFIWGPVGGSISYPVGFKSITSRESFIQRLRILDSFRLKYDPMLVATQKKSRHIVVTSHAAKRLIPQRYHHKTHVIPEGINPREITTEIATTENYIFSSGRLVPYKSFDLLIKAFSEQPAKNNIELLITGEGPDRQYLEEIIKETNSMDRIKLLGHVDRDKNKSLMKNALFCVFPAMNESFGSVNLEAMTAGKPIIVTDWGGPSDIIKDGFNGYKIQPISINTYIEELKLKITHLIENPVERIQMSKNAVNSVREFGWDKLAKKYHDLYNS